MSDNAIQLLTKALPYVTSATWRVGNYQAKPLCDEIEKFIADSPATHQLSFATLRRANLARCLQFRDKNGKLCHPDGVESWMASQWVNACFGEFGEVLECLMKLGVMANMIKKVERGDSALEEKRKEIAFEIADVQIYLDLLAAKLGIDLGAATEEKFNIVSRRVNADVFIIEDESVNGEGELA